MALGLVGGDAFCFSLLGSRERKKSDVQEPLSLVSAFKETFTNRSFLAFAGANLMICYIWSWLAAMVPFFTKYVLGVPGEQMSLILAAKCSSPRWLSIRSGGRSLCAWEQGEHWPLR